MILVMLLEVEVSWNGSEDGWSDIVFTPSNRIALHQSASASGSATKTSQRLFWIDANEAFF